MTFVVNDDCEHCHMIFASAVNAVGSIRLIIPTLFIPKVQFIPDWAISVAIGWAIMLCGRAGVRSYQRKLAIQDEIKPLSDIEIIGTQSSQTRRFAGNSPLSRFCQQSILRITEYVGNKWNQIADRWRELHFSVKCLVVIAAGFLVGASILCWAGIAGELGWALIPWAIGIGLLVIYTFLLGGATILWSITQTLVLSFIVLSALKSVCRNLPHGLVWRYRSWQLRRVARKQLRRL